jgi:acyl-CoA thioesterase I
VLLLRSGGTINDQTMRITPLYVPLLLIVFIGCRNSDLEQSEPPETAVSSRQNSAPPPATEERRGRVIVLGNSIAAGFGIEPSQAFPALLQQKIDSVGMPYTVVNAGVSGDTSAGGLRRVDWVIREGVDVFILELGGNDGLRGTPPEVTRQNLTEIIERVQDRYPDARILLAGMQIPPNLGTGYAESFRQVYSQVARDTGATLIPFVLEGVGGVRELNLPDGIHPTPAGHRIIARTVWEYLEPTLRLNQAA